MPRKLKTFQTSVGFHDLAIAAPSMKAALEAWGAGSNLFHQGAAKETDDPAIVAATMAKPGVVLKRPAGSKGRFAEHAGLPGDWDDERSGDKRRKGQSRLNKSATPKVSEKAARKAALDFEREQKRRQAERRREEANLAKERERRAKVVAKAQAALDRAREDHEAKTTAIDAERAAIEQRAQDENARWRTQKEKLEQALRRARE